MSPAARHSIKETVLLCGIALFLLLPATALAVAPIRIAQAIVLLGITLGFVGGSLWLIWDALKRKE